MKTDEFDTFSILLLRYRKPAIELEEVCKQYLHMDIKTTTEINRKASRQDFPFPVFRADPSNKRSPYLVKISALAMWLDSQAEQGQRDWEKVNG